MNTIERKIKMPINMTVHIDNDVKLVLEFILMNINSSKCIKVAQAVNALAPVLFERDIEENRIKEERFAPMAFIPPDISQ